jgi:hypothetical protein
VPITALLGLTDELAELAGYGPIPAAMAREIAADATRASAAHRRQQLL